MKRDPVTNFIGYKGIFQIKPEMNLLYAVQTDIVAECPRA